MNDEPRRDSGNIDPDQTTFDFDFGNYAWSFQYDNEQAFIDAGHQKEIDELKGRVGYLLSWDETKALGDVWGAFFGLQNEREDERKPTYQEMRQGFVECVNRGDIDKNLIVSAAEKFYNGKWWSYRDPNGWVDEGSYFPKEFDILRSDKEKSERKQLKYPREFENLSIRDKRRLFGVPSDFLYIEDEAAAVITPACAWLGIVITPKASRFLQIASSPEADPLRGINKKTIKAAEGTHEISKSEKDIYTIKEADTYKLIFTGKTRYNDYGIAVASVEADKLLKMTNAAILQNKTAPSYSFSLKEIGEMWGLKDANTTWKKVNDAAKALQGLGFDIKVQKGKSTTNFYGNLVDYIKISDAGKGKPRSITVYPGSMWRGYVTAQNTSTEQLTEKAFPLSGGAYRIAVAFSRRASTAKQYPDRLKISSLLADCDFKTPDEIKDKGHIKQLIAMPFKRELDKAVDGGVFASYRVFEKGQELTTEEFTSSQVMNDYKRFTSLTIAIEWAEDTKPDYSKRIAARAAREEEKATRKNKTRKTINNMKG